MLFSDPPIHNRLRKLVSYAFKPSHIEAQHDLVEARCDELIASMCQHEEVDLVDALAAPLPVTVIAQMLGVEDGNMRDFKRWSDKIFSNIGEILFAQPDASVRQATDDMNAYFLARIDRLRPAPGNNLLGRLIRTETEDGHLSDEELLSFCRLLLIAGNETTTGLITGCVRVFDEMPETFEALKANHDLIGRFLEETLRFYSPFSATVRRTTRATELAGVTIPEGVIVVPLIASANRDEFRVRSGGRVRYRPRSQSAFGVRLWHPQLFGGAPREARRQDRRERHAQRLRWHRDQRDRRPRPVQPSGGSGSATRENLAMSKKPNILFIFTDSSRADTMGYADDPVALTPHTDRLASEGVVFRRCCTNSPGLHDGQVEPDYRQTGSRAWGLDVCQSGPSPWSEPCAQYSGRRLSTAVVGKTHLWPHGKGHTRDHLEEMHDWGYVDAMEVPGPSRRRPRVPPIRITCRKRGCSTPTWSTCAPI